MNTAQFRNAVKLYYGIGTKHNKEAAFEVFQLASHDGNTDADLMCGVYLHATDPVEAAQCFKKAADSGNLTGQFMYGSCLHDGDGVEKNLKAAAAYFKMSADRGYAPSQCQYGLYAWQGAGIPKNVRVSAKYMKMAAEQGDPDAQYCCGDYLSSEVLGAPDFKSAIRMYKMSADQGNRGGMFKYGVALVDGKCGLETNRRKGLKYIKRAADIGVPEAQARYALEVCRMQGKSKELVNYARMAAAQGSPLSMCAYAALLEEAPSTEQDRQEGAYWWQQAADLGSTAAQARLGWCFLEGDGVPRNQGMAAKYSQRSLAECGFRPEPRHLKAFAQMKWSAASERQYVADVKQLADNGKMIFQRQYGIWLYQGSNGLAQNYAEAAKYFRLGANQGDLESQYWYGTCLYYGQGVKESMEEAAKYFKLAADQGQSEAQYMYGVCCRDGQGMTQDTKQAADYFRLSAHQGNPHGQFAYAECLFKGCGVTRNYKKAGDWFKYLAAQDISRAQVMYGLCVVQDLILRGVITTRLNAQEESDAESSPLDRESIQSESTMSSDDLAMEKDLADSGDADAQFRYGFQLFSTATMPAVQEGMVYLEKAADNGVCAAQYLVGFYKYKFFGQFEEGKLYLQKAALQGHIVAIKELAGFLFDELKEMIGAYPPHMKEQCDVNYYGPENSVTIAGMAKVFKAAADAGIATALGMYGCCLIEGLGVEKDVAHGSELIKMAVDSEDVLAMRIYGYYLVEGDGIEKNIAKGIEFIKRAADSGDQTSRVNYGYLLWAGIGVKQDMIEAAKCFKQAADAGSARGVFMYGYCLLNGNGVPQDGKRGLVEIKRAADEGYRYAEFMFGRILKEQRRYEEAATYLQRAHEHGFKTATYDYAVMMYEEGFPHRDYELAARLFKERADEGDASSQHMYGVCCSEGRGVVQNDWEAARYFKMGADNGCSSAQYNYALACHEGEGVPVNLEEAVRYLKMAADQGEEKAQVLYGVCFMEGTGVEQDLDKATQILVPLAKKGNSDARSMLLRLQTYKMAFHAIPPKRKDARSESVQPDANKKKSQQNAHGLIGTFEGFGMPPWIAKSDNGETGDAHYHKGIALFNDEELEEAVAVFKKGADLGHAECELMYGSCLYQGKGISRDPTRAFQYLQRAASKGNASAKLLLRAWHPESFEQPTYD